MSSKLMNSTLDAVRPAPGTGPIGATRFLPFALPIVIAGLFILAQWKDVMARPSTESPLVVLGLIGYISASVFFLMFLIQQEAMLEKLAIWTAAGGFGLNIAAWGTRGLIAHHYPLTNLYDTALALALTTTGATLVISAIYRQRYMGAFTLPIATMFLILAILYGDQIIDMPPVLVSYWRPIHVSIAMTAYGVTAIAFALGLLYLIKDGMRTELLGILALLVPLLTYLFLSGGSILTRGAFELSLLIGGSRIPLNEANTEFLRANLPAVGEIFRIASVVTFLTILCLAGYLLTKREDLKVVGHRLAQVALLAQAVGLGVLIYQIEMGAAWADHIIPGQRAIVPAAWLQEFGPQLELTFRSNPVGIACVFVAVGLTAFIVGFAWKRERIVAAVPSLEVLDDLTYKAVSVAFPLLVLMTITGAVWANESWGRYWGWDPKEMWAFITCLVYATFLHTRIVHGWKGRRTAMFAVLGFISVIFTYVGVSFILPGLHSYATL